MTRSSVLGERALVASRDATASDHPRLLNSEHHVDKRRLRTAALLSQAAAGIRNSRGRASSCAMSIANSLSWFQVYNEMRELIVESARTIVGNLNLNVTNVLYTHSCLQISNAEYAMLALF